MREYDTKIESLTEDETIRLINFFKSRKVRGQKKEMIKLRDLAIVTMLIYTGLRISELTNLKYSDITDDGIQIIGK
jgi:integrase